MLEMNVELEQYILAHSEPESKVLTELSRATHLNVLTSENVIWEFAGTVLENDLPDDRGPSGIGDRDIHGICRYFYGFRIGRRGNVTYD